MEPTLLAALTTNALGAAAPAPDGWIPMFNGKDLSGWKSNAASEDQPAQKADVFSVKDGEWFDYSIKVDGKHIVIAINGKVTTDWTEPADWDPAKNLSNMPGRKLGEGTIAIQGHDPKSTIHYKDLLIKPLP